MYPFEQRDRLPSRRSVMRGGLAGAFVLGFHLPAHAANEPEQPPDSTQGKFAPNAFIRIDHSGLTTLVMPQVEMGQGVYTAVAMILAQNSTPTSAKSQLSTRRPTTSSMAIRLLAFRSPAIPIQFERSGSPCPLRAAGAAARLMLIRAAAQQWQVDPASCSASSGVISHASSGRSVGYGDLIDVASTQPVPQDPPLKDPKDFTLIGKPLKRFDTPNKTDGKVVYGIDVMLPGMKFATLAQCPVFGGKVGRVDDNAAKKIPGVQQIVVLDDLAAVIGDHMWAAKKDSMRSLSTGTKAQMRK